MSAPSVIDVEASQTNSISLIPQVFQSVATASVGDLAILFQVGTASTSNGALTAPFYSGDGLTNSGADAGWTATGNDQFGSTSSQIAVYHKFLTSTDFDGTGHVRQYTPKWAHFTTPNRCMLLIFHHSNGWDSTVFNIVKTHANIGNGTWITLTDSTNPSIVVCGWTATSASVQAHVGWDGGTDNVEPYCDASTTQQTDGASGHHYGVGNTVFTSALDFKLYDASDTTSEVTWDLGLGSAAHQVIAVQFQTVTPTVTGTGEVDGGGTAHADGLRTVPGTGSVTGGGTAAATGLRTVFGTAAVDGGGTVHAEQAGAVFGTAAIDGGGTLQARGAVRGVGAVDGGGSLSANGLRTVVGTAAINGGGTAQATGIVGSIADAEGGEYHAGGLSQPARAWTDATAAISSTVTVAATGSKVATGHGLGAATGALTLHAIGTVTKHGIAAITGAGAIAAIGLSGRFDEVRIIKDPDLMVIKEKVLEVRG